MVGRSWSALARAWLHVGSGKPTIHHHWGHTKRQNLGLGLGLGLSVGHGGGSLGGQIERRDGATSSSTRACLVALLTGHAHHAHIHVHAHLRHHGRRGGIAAAHHAGHIGNVSGHSISSTAASGSHGHLLLGLLHHLEYVLILLHLLEQGCLLLIVISVAAIVVAVGILLTATSRQAHVKGEGHAAAVALHLLHLLLRARIIAQVDADAPGRRRGGHRTEGESAGREIIVVAAHADAAGVARLLLQLSSCRRSWP